MGERNNRRIGLLLLLTGLLVWFCLALFSTTALAEPENKKIITVAGDAYFPPFEFLDERDGLKVYRGFNIDLIRVVIAKTDLELQFLTLRSYGTLKICNKLFTHISFVWNGNIKFYI